MKRFLHALAALWPQRKEVVSPPVPPMSTGIRQHLAAVLQMERALCGFANLPIHEFTEEALSAGALNTVRDQSAESSAQQLPESPDTRLLESPDTRLLESPDTRLLESPDTRLIESTDTRLDDSPNQQVVESPNQPQSLPRIPQPMPLLTILMLVFFMCLMAAKQVSAQAEPAEAAKWIIPHGGVVLGDSLPDWFWEVELSVVNHPEGNEIVRMADYKDKLLVLDFWATYCKGCVASLDKWNAWLPEFNDCIQVIAPHMFDFNHKIAPFLEKKGWDIIVAYGDRCPLVHNLFFESNRFGQVWIKDGMLLAIPRNSAINVELLKDVVSGIEVDVEMEDYLTYFDSRKDPE